MIPRPISRRLRPFLILGAGYAIWANRHDVERWRRFAVRAFHDRRPERRDDLLTEARVRLAITTDPVLRRDQSLDDVVVLDGVVTLFTRTPNWRPADPMERIERVKGVTTVAPRNAA